MTQFILENHDTNSALYLCCQNENNYTGQYNSDDFDNRRQTPGFLGTRTIPGILFALFRSCRFFFGFFTFPVIILRIDVFKGHIFFRLRSRSCHRNLSLTSLRITIFFFLVRSCFLGIIGYGRGFCIFIASSRRKFHRNKSIIFLIYFNPGMKILIRY